MTKSKEIKQKAEMHEKTQGLFCVGHLLLGVEPALECGGCSMGSYLNVHSQVCCQNS